MLFNGKKIKKILSFLISISAILIVLYISYYETMPKVKSPKVINGSLDLSKWDFETEGIVFLNGEWDFYPERLVEPSDIKESALYHIKVPGNWNMNSPLQLPRGSGTYHVSITLPKHKEKLQLKVQNIWMSHRLFINGSMVKEMGHPSDSIKSNIPKNTPYLVDVEASDKLDIVFQVSNYVYYDGGIIHPIQLGNEKDMEMRYQLSFGTDMAGFFLLLLFGVFHLNMYQMRERETTYLYSGIYLIILSFMTITTGEKVFMKFMDNIPFQIAYKFQDLCFFSGFPILLLFIKSLESEVMTKKIYRIIVTPIILFLIIFTISPYGFYTNLKAYLHIYVDILLLFFVSRLIYILVQKKYNKVSMSEFIYIVASVGFITLVFVDSAFYHLGYINTNIIGKASLVAFILSLNLLLSRRFTNKMNEVQALTENLKIVNQIKDEFLVMTTHELKTPLLGISNISSQLAGEDNRNLTVEQRENVSLIKDISVRLSYLVNDLNDVVRLRHGDLSVNIRMIDLYVLAQVVFQILSFDIEGKKLKLINMIKPMTFVQADENRLKQILYNMIYNAIKFTDSGKIIAKTMEDKENIILIISDTGMGITNDIWNTIFEDPYERIDFEVEEKKWTGLGLYISRQLARLMKGDIWVSNSVIGKGTDMSIRLPKGYEENGIINNLDENETGRDINEEIYELNKESKVRKILIVDDEHINIKILTMILEKEFQVFKAFKGENALKILNENSIDLVITDILMPGMSGIELIQTIRKNYSIIDLPIIVSTSKYSDADIQLAYQAGADDYITKPFSEEVVMSRVNILLQLTEAMDKALKSEIAFLQAQIKPHFIYNALSNIIALCYEDGERAAELLTLLSRYLRYIFQMDQLKQMITIQHELDIINTYVEIEKLRFGNRLKYETYIDSSINEDKFEIPALIIQPLVENAIRHGIFNKEGEGTVILRIMEGKEFISIIVEDDGIGMSVDDTYQILHSEDSSGVGINNIKRRIRSFSGASFSIDSEFEKGTKCRLFLPKRMLRAVKEGDS